jgi:uncharacterized membrane protein YhaH (DUF805 family)
MNYFIHCLKNYANFNGRARRKEFWMFILFSIVFSIIFSILDSLLGTSYKFNYSIAGKEIPMSIGYLSSVFSLVLLVPSIAVGVRRIHDVGKSGWLYVVFYGLTIFCCVGIFPWIYFMVKAGDVGENLYGPDPKAY